MAEIYDSSAYAARPFADRVARVTADAPFTWLAAGWRDFRASLAVSLTYGLIFVLAGALLTWALYAANVFYLFVPLATVFMLGGPAATLGLYAISRALEAGRKPSLSTALLAFRTN